MSNPKTKRGATRQINAVLNKYRKDFAGGGQYGFDVPTFLLNSPALYSRYVELKTLYPSLPD